LLRPLLMRLAASYFLHHDVNEIARDLLGKILCTKIDGQLTSGIIVETEAYAGIGDRASHAYGGRRTRRTETMYGKGGVSYIYLCYGIHHLFNIVTNSVNEPDAVLIRAFIPLEGISEILKRRRATSLSRNLCVGPGKVSLALGLNLSHNNLPLSGKSIWLKEDKEISEKYMRGKKIQAGPRIGVDYAGPDAKLPYRYWIEQTEIEHIHQLQNKSIAKTRK
jgi:DNA-3-methyladenine glycosylase